LRTVICSRNSSGALTITPVSALRAALRAFTAPSRATRSRRIDSTIPVVSLAITTALWAST